MASTYPIDLCFDLDAVLTRRENSPDLNKSECLVSKMPTISTSDVCAVCMEGLDRSKDSKQTPCGHAYHASCISAWLSLRNSCPVCRCCISGKI